MTHPSHPRRHPRYGPARIGALYDLVIAVTFATPWTARLALDGVRALHTGLDLPGRNLDAFAPEHLLFVNFFGVVVTVWAVVRLTRGDTTTAAADTVGRVAFALLMAWALAAGVTSAVAAFLVIEVALMLAQGWELARARRATALPTGDLTSP